MLTRQQMKTHCRIDGDDENDLLDLLSLAAHEHLCLLTNRNWYAENTPIPQSDELGLHITPLAQQAMLLMVGAWYENRETDWQFNAQNQIPSAVDALIAPYRVYGL